MLVGAGAAELVRGEGGVPRPRAWLVGGLLGIAADLDVPVGLALGRGGFSIHGTFTHALVAVVAVWIVARLAAGREWARISAAGYLSHLIIDALEYGRATSIQLAWPFSEATLPSVASFFPHVPWQRGEGPDGAAISLLHPDVFPWLAAQTAVGLGFFALALLVRRLVADRSGTRGPTRA